MKLGEIDGLKKLPVDYEGWQLDADDFLVYALLTDTVYMSELLWEDPTNREYDGCYKVRDYQYPLFRADEQEALFACGRSTGKTESIKARSQRHAFKRIGQNLLLTTPELIHLLPLTDAIEDNLLDCRLTRELLDKRNQGTGFQHRPFQANFVDGTKIVGRIPKITGTGVKGQHQPDLIIDEGQDYPAAGYTEVHETVMRETVDQDGNPDYHYHVFGVHSGDRSGAFFRMATQGAFVLRAITALMRPDWNKQQKDAAKSAYGGTSSPDYRRNILGEPGSAASAYFVIARLMACLDQNRESPYNTQEYRHIELRVEEVDEMTGGNIHEFAQLITGLLDLPSGYQEVYVGIDIGLTSAPTVITIFARVKVGKVVRMKLIRRITLERFRTRQQREVLYALWWHFESALKGLGIDSTGLGFPIWQEVEDDEACPPGLLEVSRAYKFNALVPVNVQKEHVTEDQSGQLKDQFGSTVKEEVDENGVRRLVTYMPMIEASTRYLREFVDQTFLLLPFDPEIVQDMQGETRQRVQRVAGMKSKPNALHTLDAMRAFAMVVKGGDIEAQLAQEAPEPVLDLAMD